MDLQKTLIRLGLSSKQAQVYLACLQLGCDTVVSISKFCGLKRPTVYLILDDLEAMGLVSKTREIKKTLFKAEDPKRLLTDLRTKQEMAEIALPSLQAIYNLDPEKPNIKIGEGVLAVRNAYNGIFTHISKHPQEELLIFGSLKDAAATFEEEVVSHFYQKMAESQNRIREIGNDDHETRKYYRASRRLNENHDIRLIRNEGQFWKSDNMLYGNTLVIFSVKEQIFVITIESSTITTTYRTLFNMAWRSGKRI
ncbi:MAG TPA: helix-turn-helix domain-containing protein [Patescibacteria group bacterium]|nr:helix-turn-helix domain-containing protein [Patescibacteria group bacterium]